MLRSLLFDDPAGQRFQDLIFSNLRSMLKARLIARRPLNYVDATNLTPHERQSWIKLGHDYGYEVQAVFFDVPLEVCLERNHKRERVIADDVMRRMSAKLKAPTLRRRLLQDHSSTGEAQGMMAAANIAANVDRKGARP